MRPETKMILLTALMMSCAMSLFFSGFFTWLNLGTGPVWLRAWGRGFAIGWPMGFCLALLIGGPIRALSMRLAGIGRR